MYVDDGEEMMITTGGVENSSFHGYFFNFDNITKIIPLLIVII